MKTIKTEIPEGYEIDTENSIFERIVFKPIEEKWVDSWEKLGTVSGYWWYEDSAEHYAEDVPTKHNANKNISPTLKDAKSVWALAQLLQLRKRVIGDWEADWNDNLQNKYVIARFRDKVGSDHSEFWYNELSFPTPEISNKFIEKYKRLLVIYFKL